MIDYATPWSFLLSWKVIWEQQKLSLALGKINTVNTSPKNFEKIPSCIFSAFVHLLMFLDTILKLVRARSEPFFRRFFPSLFKDLSSTIKKGLCVIGVGYVDFKPRNAGLLSTSAGYNILNFKACLVNELINIRFFHVLKR